MPSALELLREGRNQELWEKCCGFINLNRDQFMAIQDRLLLEQLELLRGCELGRKIMRGAQPRTVEEFRRQVPITVYQDYAPYLPEKKEDALPEKPLLWQRTSGRSSESSYKWVPVTKRVYQELGDMFMALLLFSSCSERGEVAFKEHDKFLYALAPPPYASGCWAHRLTDEGIFDFLPSVEEAEKMEFAARIEEGFRLGMSAGIDMMAGISVLLITVGERFGQGGSMKRVIPMLTKPKLLARLMNASIKARIAGRRMMPKDIWHLKGLVSSGTDANVYRERIREMWGRYPLDIYGATECVTIAMQTWDFGDMTFVPNLNFLEFMTRNEYTKWAENNSYRPVTLLVNELMPGEKYVVVVTNFHGGAFIRYMLGDMIKVTSLSNPKLNINIPQMKFYSRVDGVMDFTYASFTEKSIWQTIEDSGISYVDWVARKEVKDKPLLHLYIELKDRQHSEEEVATAIEKQFKSASEEYSHLEEGFGFNPLKVTLLSSGAFADYIARRQSTGADPAHLKPPHIDPSDEVLAVLTNGKSEAVVKT